MRWMLLFRWLAGRSLRTVHGLGSLAGWLVYWVSPTYRRRLVANLERAVGPVEGRRLCAAAIAEAGKQSLELLWVWLRPVPDVLTQVREAPGFDLLRQAPGGVIVLTPHMGCFELLPFYAVHYAGRTGVVLYRKPRRAEFEPLVRLGRAREGIRLASADVGGVRAIMKALRAGEVVGILPDQVPAAGEGVWAPFFGRQAWTMSLAARLSEMKDVTVLLAWSERLPEGKGFVLHMKALSPALEGSTQARCEAINKHMEALILQKPEQYLWGYNRYKRPPGVAPRPGEPVGSGAP